MTITVRLSDDILHKLRTTGLTSARAGELLGVGPRQAEHLLKRSGAIKGTNTPKKWRLP
jgi:hypothetical protein